MEYSSPGRTPFWLLAILTSLTYVMNLSMTYTSGQQHGIRHKGHYDRQQAGSHRFHDFDYEDSTVVLQPEFLNTKSNITVRVGDLATLPCAVRNLGTKQVAWRRLGAKDNHFLTVGTFTWVRENNIQVDHKMEEGQISHWNLIIKSVQQDDEGTYQCQITDKVPLRTHVHLTVKPRPQSKPSAVVLTGKEFVDRNEPIILLCNATGGPTIPEDIDWFKDGTKLRATVDSKILLTKYRSLEYQALISNLTIEHTDIDDSGTYICRSSDREIDSLKVTVLVADTTNVKRGTGAQQDEQENGVNRSRTACTAAVFLTSAVSFLLAGLLL